MSSGIHHIGHNHSELEILQAQENTGTQPVYLPSPQEIADKCEEFQ